MEKEFVPYEEALALKVLGFNEMCFAGYRDSNWIGSDGPNSKYFHAQQFRNSQFDPDQNECCSAPLYQQAFRWFRETYGKHVILFSDGIQWTFDLRWVLEDDIMQYPCKQFPKKEVGRTMHDTYEEAQIAALRKLIEIVQ